MPVSPNEVFEQFRQQVIKKTIDDIDQNILRQANLEWSRTQVDVILPDPNLSRKERNEICKIYEGIGWARVETRTSEENGERPGLLRVTLYAPTAA